MATDEIFATKTTPIFAQPEFLKTQLRPHQQVGVGWMVHRESHPFRGCRGGMVLDDVGLGKTLQLLTTIYAQRANISGPTLIISDRQIMDVWKHEIASHFAPGHSLSTYTYHGKPDRDLFKSRDTQQAFLEGFDIVFTTYDILSVEKNQYFLETAVAADPNDPTRRHSPFIKGSLFLNRFGRIILDEAHKIRNRSTGYYKGAMRLRGNAGTVRWALSAQPVLNRLDDLFPLMQFLEIQPFCEPQHGFEQWHSTVVRPIQYNARTGMRTLQETMIPVTLRRTKAILNLPSIHKTEEEILFSDEEFDFYSKLYQYVRDRVERLLARIEEIRQSGGRVDPDDHRSQQARASVNVMITRLRQACCSTSITIKAMRRFNYLATHDAADAEVLRLCRERIEYIITHPNEIEECAICMDADATYIAIPCRHLCCRECWEKTSNKCPFCRSNVESYREVSASTASALVPMIDEPPTTSTQLPAKVVFLLTRLKEHIQDEKAIVVSDFASYLDVIAEALQKDDVLKGVRVARVDGKVTGDRRFEVIRAFQSTEADTPRILLMTYRCGGEGVTLTSATHLYEMNPWWNEAQMYQAEGRLHRLGQSKPVFIHQLRIAGTIEDKIYEMVDRKGFLSRATMNKHERAPDKIPWANRVRLMVGLDDLAPARASQRRRLAHDGSWAPTGIW